jgi:tRNA pseudouridine55 synthase
MNGVINFLKPPGMSSNGAVVFLRHLLGEKTGHAGTLDPGASGVLPILVGKATRISSYVMSGRKEYIAEVTFGISTDTGDSYGQITARSNEQSPRPDEVKEALTQFTGIVTQLTPAYSAVKQDGMKRYQLARKGIALEERPREIEIYETEYLGATSEISHRIHVICGKGTYIRTLCEDIGQVLGVPAYMSFLVRTRCAGLDVRDAWTADELQVDGVAAKALMPLDEFLTHLPLVDGGADKRRLLSCGATVAYEGERIETARIFAGGELIGLGCAGDGEMKISTLLVDE